MTEKLGIYKCGVCGNVAEVLEHGAGDLICCGQPMALLSPQTADPAAEKHMPFAEAVDGGLHVRLGQNEPHPMDRKHWIQWIEIVTDTGTMKRLLTADDSAEALFVPDSKVLSIRALCNLHGLWQAS